jgi:hypothetical protein
VLFRFIVSVFLGIGFFFFTGISAHRFLICSRNTLYMSSVCMYIIVWAHCLESLILYANFNFSTAALKCTVLYKPTINLNSLSTYHAKEGLYNMWTHDKLLTDQYKPESPHFYNTNQNHHISTVQTRIATFLQYKPELPHFYSTNQNHRISRLIWYNYHPAHSAIPFMEQCNFSLFQDWSLQWMGGDSMTSWWFQE